MADGGEYDRLLSASKVGHRAKIARHILEMGRLPRSKARLKALTAAVEKYSRSMSDTDLFAVAALADEVLLEFGWDR